LLDCLIDLPSDAHAASWAIPDVEDVTQAFADGDKWRLAVHVGDLQFASSAGPQHQGAGVQGWQIGVRELGGFLVDHPDRLSHGELVTAESRLPVFLSSIGFVRFVEVSNLSVACIQIQPEASSLGPPWRSIEVSLGSISGHACADTVQSLLCASMELVEVLPSLATEISSRQGQQDRPQQTPHSDEGKTANLPSRSLESQTNSSPGLSILQNIDMFAFESQVDHSHGTPCPQDPPALWRGTSAASSHAATESCLIDDYIRAQEEQQTLRSPIQASQNFEDYHDGPVGDMELLELPDAFPTTGDMEPSSTTPSVAVCLLDPEAFPEGHLRELCLQDQTAHLEVQQIFGRGHEQPLGQQQQQQQQWQQRDTGFHTATAPRLPQAASDASRKVLHQDGSAAVWFVDPAEVQVVHDHFTVVAEPEEDQRLNPPAQAPPSKLSVTFRCGTARLSLYAGLDFQDGMGAAASSGALGSSSNGERTTAHLVLDLQHSVVKLMHFDVPMALVATGTEHPPLHGACVLRRRLVVCARDFGILDRLPSSAFSHVLSHFADERRRPRPNNCDMLHLILDEVSLAALGGTPVDEAGIDMPEYRLDLRLLPLRLTIDQDAVDFVANFIQLCTAPAYIEEEEVTASDHVDDGLVTEEERPVQRGPASKEPFFQRASFSALLLSVDYRAKRLDVDALRRGELWELVNLLPLLEGLQVALRSMVLTDVAGLGELLAQVVSHWSAELNRTQILRSLTGVTPIRSIANIGGGFAEMVLEPLRQYNAGKGSQQVSRTLLRGLVSFLRHVTVESFDLTERIFVGAQSALEFVNSRLSEHGRDAGGSIRDARAAGGDGVHGGDWREADGASLSAQSLEAVGEPPPQEPLVASQSWTPVERGAAGFLQPDSAADGLQQACASLSRGVRDAGQAVVARPLLEFQRGAPREQVLRTVVSGIPMCVLRPAIGATAAATTALRGVRNSVDPLRRQEIAQKLKSPE